MEVFEGTVRIAGDAVALPAVLLVADNRLRVSARQQQIGDWQLTDVSANLEPDGCHVVVEGEELVVSVPELLRFAEAIGPHMTNPGDGSLRDFGRRSVDEHNAPGPAGNRTGRIRLSPAMRLGIGVGLITVSLVFWAPLVLVGLLLLTGLAALLLGGFALMDPYLAVRIPGPVTPSFLFRMGVGGVGIAIALSVVL
jgi:hypothetical protein